MEFGFDSGPHLKDKDNTSKIMSRLFIALLPIILFAIYKNGILPYNEGHTNLYGALRPVIMLLLGVGTSLLTEAAYTRFSLKIKDNLAVHMKETYAIFPGLFLVLVLPINTPLWVVVVGSFVATFIGKLLFGGFGYNVFNPALVGVLFVIASYGALITSRGGYLNPTEIDTLAGATALSNLNNLNYVGTWSTVVQPFGSLFDFFVGFIPGSIGETSKLLIILGFLYLVLTRVIKWVVPVTYVAVVFIMTYIIGLTNNLDVWYPLFQILSGGLLFGAVFMATDPVTSPTTKTGQVLYGLGLGLLTVIFRFLTPYPEGVLTSILTMNMLVFVIDRIGARAKFKIQYKIIPVIILILVIISLSFYIGNGIKPSTTPIDNKFKIIDVKESGNQTIYTVSQKGFHGPIDAIITIEKNKIISINVTSQSETYWAEIENQNYLNTLISNQGKLDEVDTISGATVSSSALKSMVRKVLNDYEVRK